MPEQNQVRHSINTAAIIFFASLCGSANNISLVCRASTHCQEPLDPFAKQPQSRLTLLQHGCSLREPGFRLYPCVTPDDTTAKMTLLG